MPSKSQKQHDLMIAVVAGKSTAVPKSVAREYLRKDAEKRKYASDSPLMKERKNRHKY